jgi:hypothetical protein
LTPFERDDLGAGMRVRQIALRSLVEFVATLRRSGQTQRDTEHQQPAEDAGTGDDQHCLSFVWQARASHLFNEFRGPSVRRTDMGSVLSSGQGEAAVATVVVAAASLTG